MSSLSSLWYRIPSTVREYIWSSTVTFTTAFLGTAIPLLQINVSSPFTEALILSVAATAFRAAVRALLNLATTWFVTTSSDPNKA